MSLSMLLPAGALRAATVPGVSRAVAVFTFAVALSAPPAWCVLQRRPPLRYRGLVKLSSNQAVAPWAQSLPEAVVLLVFVRLRWCSVPQGAATPSLGQDLRVLPPPAS